MILDILKRDCPLKKIFNKHFEVQRTFRGLRAYGRPYLLLRKTSYHKRDLFPQEDEKPC